MRVLDIDFSAILLNEKSNENILVYDISCNTFMGAKSFYILFSFLLITITLLIAVSISCYLIKYKAK